MSIDLAMVFEVPNKRNSLWVRKIYYKDNIIYGEDWFTGEEILIMEYENAEQVKIEMKRVTKNYRLHKRYKFPSLKQHKHYQKMAKRLRSD